MCSIRMNSPYKASAIRSKNLDPCGFFFRFFSVSVYFHILYQMDDGQGNDGQHSEASTSLSSTWNSFQEGLLKSISERSNCMRWLHNQCQLYFESMNFYLTIPNVIISTLNGSFTMSLTSLFPDEGQQRYATTIIGLVSIFSAVLITMNQYVKSQQMMEAHRAAGLAYGKLYRVITNELALRRDQRQNALDFLKAVRQEQDRLENSSPSILPAIIKKFNKQFEHRNIEKPEIAGDLDEVNVNKTRRHQNTEDSYVYSPRPVVPDIGRRFQAVASAVAGPLLRQVTGATRIFPSQNNGKTGRTSPTLSIPAPPPGIPPPSIGRSVLEQPLISSHPPNIVVDTERPPTPPLPSH